MAEEEFREVQQAIARAEGQRAKLVRALDGKRLYSDQEHAERERVIANQLESDLDVIIQAARTDEAEARAELGRLEVRRDPLVSLPTADLQRAAALQSFVREDVEALPWADVLSRIEVSKSDKVLTLLMIHYARRRVAAEREGTTDLPKRVELQGVEDVLTEYERAFADPKMAERKQALQERIERSWRLVGAAAKHSKRLQAKVDRLTSL